MFNSFKKIIFIVLGLFLVSSTEASMELSEDPTEEKKEETLVPVKEFTSGEVKAAAIPNPLPTPLYINATENTDYIIPGTRAMDTDGFCEIRIRGAVERSPYNKTWKIQHPIGSGAAYKKAAIYIIAHVGAGDTDRLLTEFASAFLFIARLVHPYIYRHLINEETLPSGGAWKGVFAPPDAADGVHMSIGDEPFKQMRRETFISGLSTYYNSLPGPQRSLVLDLLDPRTDDSVERTVTGNEVEDNGAYKMQSVALNPTGSLLPVYDSSTAPFGVETIGGEKILHVPLGIGCKSPTITYFHEKETIKIKAFLVVSGTTQAEGPCKVLLEGDNSYVDPTMMDFCIYRGGTAVITNAASLPPTNIVINSTAVPTDPTTDYRNSTLTFPSDFASMTTFTLSSGITLSMTGNEKALAEIVVPNNVTFDMSAATKSVSTGSSLVIERGGCGIW